MTRLKSILVGANKNVTCFAIGTPENPMGQALSASENNKRIEDFELQLSLLRVQFIKISGRYAQNDEHSYLIPNISLKICKELFGFNGFDQESFIYGENKKDGVEYQLWGKGKGDTNYSLWETHRGIVSSSDLELFSFKKNFKFVIDWNIFKESKLKSKKLTEKFVPEWEDWDFETMAEKYGKECLEYYNSDDQVYSMEDLDDIYYNEDPLDILTRAYFGGRYGFKEDSFNPTDDFFYINAYANLVSINEHDLVKYLMDVLDEETFYNWCEEQEYFD